MAVLDIVASLLDGGKSRMSSAAPYILESTRWCRSTDAINSGSGGARLNHHEASIYRSGRWTEAAGCRGTTRESQRVTTRYGTRYGNGEIT